MSTLLCACGAVYRASAQAFSTVDAPIAMPATFRRSATIKIVASTPCPNCGEDDAIASVQGDPDTYRREATP
jgi:hypothetical protein